MTPTDRRKRITDVFQLAVQMPTEERRRFVERECRGDDTLMLTENQSTYIPLGAQHRLENPGRIPLHLIEVQSGSYLGEDDIVRLEDTYGRV